MTEKVKDEYFQKRNVIHRPKTEADKKALLKAGFNHVIDGEIVEYGNPALQKAIEEAKKSVEKEVAKLNATIEKLGKEVSELTEKNGILESKNKELGEKISALEAEKKEIAKNTK